MRETTQMHDPYDGPGRISRAEMKLINHMRMLWEQHSAWTRMAITSIVFKLPNETNVVNRLLRNPHDFARVFRSFYGDTMASSFDELLTDHLVIAAELVKAAMAGNTREAEDAERRWYRNADDIAILLASVNPYWSREAWRAMLFEHLAFVKTEAVQMLNKDYEASIETYDRLEIQSLEMADMMARGIIRQFPFRF